MFDDRFSKVLSSGEYFSYVQVPDTWATLEEFVDWYLDLKMPMMIPWDAPVTCSDDATAIVLFKKPPYQAELYLVHPQQFVPHHSHPNMEVMTLFLAGGSTSPTNAQQANGMGRAWGQLGHKVMPGEYHGGSKRPIDKNGFGLIAFQRWYNVDEMRTAAVQWKGNLAGPKQAELIRQAYPNAHITSDHADISGAQP